MLQSRRTSKVWLPLPRRHTTFTSSSRRFRSEQTKGRYTILLHTCSVSVTTHVISMLASAVQQQRACHHVCDQVLIASSNANTVRLGIFIACIGCLEASSVIYMLRVACLMVHACSCLVRIPAAYCSLLTKCGQGVRQADAARGAPEKPAETKHAWRQQAEVTLRILTSLPP